MTKLYLTKVFLKNMSRQKSIIFSCFILPIVIIWSTWWVTADLPMIFELVTGSKIQTNMIDVHIITGGLTAMGITAGLFGFIVSTSNQNISQRLLQVGYSSTTINIGLFLSLIMVLFLATIISVLLSLVFAKPESLIGFIISIFLTTLIYASIGNLLGNLYPNLTAGSLFLLIFSFMDLMLITNPMGEGIYLSPWTYYVPGFWPVQIALISGFSGLPKDLMKMTFLSFLYFSIVFTIGIIIKKLGIVRRLNV